VGAALIQADRLTDGQTWRLNERVY